MTCSRINFWAIAVPSALIGALFLYAVLQAWVRHTRLKLAEEWDMINEAWSDIFETDRRRRAVLGLPAKLPASVVRLDDRR